MPASILKNIMATHRGHFEQCNGCGITFFKASQFFEVSANGRWALQFVEMHYQFSECPVNGVLCLCVSQPPPTPIKTAHEFLCEQLFGFLKKLEINGYVMG
jgi:hypothetical protein